MAKYQDTRGYKAATEAQRLNFGCRQTILIESERIKRQTIANRPLLHRTIKTARARGSLYFKPPPVPIILTTDNLYPAPFGGARLDFYSLGAFRDFRGLLDVEVENSLVKVSLDSSILLRV